MQYYKLVFEGISSNTTIEKASSQLSSTFKLPQSQAIKLLNTPGTVVKRNISKPKARELKLALAKISIQSRIEAIPISLESGIAKQDIASTAALHRMNMSEQKKHCPKCQFEIKNQDTCENCGIIIAKYEAQQAADPQNRPKRYGIAAAEENQQSDFRKEPPPPLIPNNLRAPLIVASTLMLLGFAGYEWKQLKNDQQLLAQAEAENAARHAKLSETLYKPGILKLSINKVDSLSMLVVPGEITIIDFYDNRCGSCNRRSQDLQDLARKVPSAIIRRFDISDKGLYQQAAKKYNFQGSPIRHARIYDQQGDLRVIDKSEEDRPASKLIHRWAFFGEKPHFTDDV